MDIVFISAKLRKECNEENLLVRRHGPRRAELLKRRLSQLSACDNLEGARMLSQLRCHELIGNRKGQLSVDLDHPYRLIFKPAHNPVPRRPDGGLDWEKVTAIIIIGIEDTHE
jgi:plasmid maintenance system killer protein